MESEENVRERRGGDKIDYQFILEICMCDREPCIEIYIVSQ
jgi:hypothetical protein